MLKPNGLAGFHKDWIILQLIFVCTLAQHEKQQDLWLGRRAGSFRPALFKDFLKENRCGKPAWERWGRSKKVSKERGCSLPTHHGVFEQQGLPQVTLVITRAGFGPCGSAQGLCVTACPASVGPFWAGRVCCLRKGFYLITPEPTCRHSPAQQNRWSPEETLKATEWMKKLNRRV